MTANDTVGGPRPDRVSLAVSYPPRPFTSDLPALAELLPQLR